MKFICAPCKKDNHNECNGGTYCDCQHKTEKGPEGGPSE
jgi:hypothetical protein